LSHPQQVSLSRRQYSLKSHREKDGFIATSINATSRAFQECEEVTCTILRIIWRD
ncbi:hypothetical protein TSMEX_004056, partial [Taenia solium]